MDDPDSSITVYIILAALILAAAFFAMGEAAVTAYDARLRKNTALSEKKAKILAGFLERPERFLLATRAGITFFGFMAAVMAAHLFAGRLGAALQGIWDIPEFILRVVSAVLVTSAAAFTVLVLGDIVPRRIASRRSEGTMRALCGPLWLAQKLMRPFTAAAYGTAGLILRFLGIGTDEFTGEVTEEDIRMMIDAGEEHGSIGESEKEMLHSIFELDDIDVENMITHRTELTAIDVLAGFDETIALATESGYSRIPVYKDDLDNVVGILYSKDLLRLVNSGREGFSVDKYMRAPLFVPQFTSGKLLLKEFKEKKIQMAVVVDEYGGTLGIVTMEDVIESIVGSIQDEYDDDEEPIARTGENQFLIDGLTPLEDVARFFGLELEDEDDFDTIGGYILGRLGYIPEGGECPGVPVEGVLFTVRSMDERRVDRLEAFVGAL
ncbi:MAG: hemolysin family protein [Oscillospiraceae bacterium]|nr:hemolysin family protein [Oscillospiraceae bacterium]